MEKLLTLKETIKLSISQIFRNDLLGFMVKGQMLLMLVSVLFFIPIAIPVFSFMAKVTEFQDMVESSEMPLPKNPLEFIAPNSFEVVMFIVGLLLVIAFAYVSLSFSILITLRIANGTTEPLKPLLKTAFRRAPVMFGHLFIKGLLLFLGFLLLIVPGIILMVMFAFSETVLINENLGPLQSLKRSYELTKGYKWNIYLKMAGLFGLQMLLIVPFLAFAAVLGNKSLGPVFIEVYAVIMQLIFIHIYRDLVRVKSTGTSTVPAETSVSPQIL